MHPWSKHKINQLKHEDVGDPCRSDEVKDDRPPSPSTGTVRDGSHAASTSVSSGSAKLGYRVTNVTMTSYLLKANYDHTLAATIARMTACDGLPFRVFAISKDMRRILIDSGFPNLPTSANSIWVYFTTGGKFRNRIRQK